MHTTTDTEAIEAALDACEGVNTVHSLAADPLRIEVFAEDGVSMPAEIADVLAEYDLRIWTVNFEWRSLTLVRASELDYTQAGESQ